MSDRLRPRHVADILGVKLSTVYAWRSRNYGPPSYLFGGAVVYERAELEAWIAAQKNATSRGAA